MIIILNLFSPLRWNLQFQVRYYIHQNTLEYSVDYTEQSDRKFRFIGWKVTKFDQFVCAWQFNFLPRCIYASMVLKGKYYKRIRETEFSQWRIMPRLSIEARQRVVCPHVYFLTCTPCVLPRMYFLTCSSSCVLLRVYFHACSSKRCIHSMQAMNRFHANT